jgi:putative DNA-binding protein
MITPAIARERRTSGKVAFAPLPVDPATDRAEEGALAKSRPGHADAIALLARRYPIICRLLGDESFRVMARHYMSSELGRCSSRLAYGDTFPQFLRSRGSAASIEYVADIATLEMLREKARRSPQAVPVSPSALSALRIGRRSQIRLELHPSAFTVTSRFPIVTVWENNRPDGSDAMITRWCAESAVVARPLLEVEVRRLPAGGHAFLNALSEDRTLGAALAAAKAAAPGFDADANLGLAIEANLVVGFHDRPRVTTSSTARGDPT